MHTRSIIAATIGVAGIANALPALSQRAEQGWAGGGGPGGNLGEAIGDIVDASMNHGDDNDWHGSHYGGRCDPRFEDCGDWAPGGHRGYRPQRYNDDDDWSWKRDAQADESQLRQYRPQQQQQSRPQQNDDDDEADNCQAQCIQYCQTFLNEEAPQCAQECPQQCNQINSQSTVDPQGLASSGEAFCAIFDQYADDQQIDPDQLNDNQDQDGFSQWQSVQGDGRGDRQSLSSNQVQDQDRDTNQKRGLPGLDLLNGIGGGADQVQTSNQQSENTGFGSDSGRTSGYRTNSYGTDGYGTENNLENNQVQNSNGGGVLNPLSSLSSVGGITDGLVKEKRQLPGLSLLNGIGGGGVQNQESTQSVNGFNPDSELENNQVQSSNGGGVLNPLSSLTSGSGIIKRQGGSGIGSVVGNPLNILGGSQRQQQAQSNRQTAGDNSNMDNTQLAEQDLGTSRINSDDEDENDFGDQRLETSQLSSGDGEDNQVGNQRFGASQVDATGRGGSRAGTSGFQADGFRTSGAGRGSVVGGTPSNSKCPLWVKSGQQQRVPTPYKA
ncbi:hypothetical protein CLAFUW4_05596 [Fulvia fulva]|uniref:Uncharacterized protein n=1 Tax=Passalora fulva TaxID=5499 RepID=A0A9Q8P954_PASFU|nr:uncharacterized protein CLAFUR5_05738 [Fulvia fulva]KAK4624683.1 hypothetical protein CLAFUR4_05591 [Fulvia fulva]KAK4625818.1 hypothetical protein CLAFUR0_05599 [Fulvia fulva]UJO17940.1 hypothetical protein CLAFUR5_05738 [Fulvia fulva]WPV14706.1 hypothetical protein CLAFUW4_05596 [Fulvia fulva]WPV30023.1 hypothetical protein CLAFUW7_05595 [Fulvia fulva]